MSEETKVKEVNSEEELIEELTEEIPFGTEPSASNNIKLLPDTLQAAKKLAENSSFIKEVLGF